MRYPYAHIANINSVDLLACLHVVVVFFMSRSKDQRRNIAHMLFAEAGVFFFWQPSRVALIYVVCVCVCLFSSVTQCERGM